MEKNINDTSLISCTLICIFIAILVISVLAIIKQPTRNTCIVGSRWYGNCSIDGEYEGTKKINCDVANGKIAYRYTFYTTGDCYPNTDTGWIQLYNEHGIKR